MKMTSTDSSLVNYQFDSKAQSFCFIRALECRGVIAWFVSPESNTVGTRRINLETSDVVAFSFGCARI